MTVRIWRRDERSRHRSLRYGQMPVCPRDAGPLDVWSNWAETVSGKGVDCGHFIPKRPQTRQRRKCAPSFPSKQILWQACTFPPAAASEGVNLRPHHPAPYNDFFHSITKIGLALGGGGARGLAHIPVLEAFDDLGLKHTRSPAPLSVRSWVPAMPADLAVLISARLPFRRWPTGTLSSRKSGNCVLDGSFNVFKNAPLQLDPHKVLEIFIGAHIKNTFEELDISLRILATDFYGCKEVAFESGPLLPAIAASIAIPAVFKPVQHQERLLVDGGAVNPLPFDELTSSCDIVVAI